MDIVQLLAIFLRWRPLLLEWNISPERVLDRADPREDLGSLQCLNAERHLVLARILTDPRQSLPSVFSEVFLQLAVFDAEGKIPNGALERYLERWLRVYLRYVDEVLKPSRFPASAFTGWNGRPLKLAGVWAIRPFAELWPMFLNWRPALIEWGLSPRVALREVGLLEELGPLQYLNDEKHRALSRLVADPARPLASVFTEAFLDRAIRDEEGKIPEHALERYLEPLLRAYLRYAAEVVPPNYRKYQLLLFPYEGLEPLRGCPPPQGQRPS